MFTKLRNKFLILNMSITSMVMIAAFAIIYLITYSNIHSEIKNKLNAQLETQLTIDETVINDNMEKGRTTISLDGPLSFNIEVDENGKILKINTSIDMPDEAYYEAAETAWSNKKTIPQ
jgi:two-component system sensor histidine kinase CiaH